VEFLLRMGNSTSVPEPKPAELGRSKTTERIHVALLGDSTFDNGGYVGLEGKGVHAHLTEKLAQVPGAYKVTHCAVDGALIAAIASQSSVVPEDATHLVISVGGNNGLCTTSMFASDCSNVAEACVSVYTVVAQLEREYLAMVRGVYERFGGHRHITLCSVYNPCFSPYDMRLDQRAVNLAVTLFADMVIRTGAKFGLPVIDFRRLMTEPSDFANPIEPSHTGGEKIAQAIANVIAVHPFNSNISIVYPLRIPELDFAPANFVKSTAESLPASSSDAGPSQSMRAPSADGQLAIDLTTGPDE